MPHSVEISIQGTHGISRAYTVWNSGDGVYEVFAGDIGYPVMPMPIYGKQNSDGKYTFYEFYDNFNYRKYLEAYCEKLGEFGGIGRDGYFRFYELASAGLFPSETLYPSYTLYPSSEENNASLDAGTYISAWHEEKLFKYDRLYCAYKDTNDDDAEYEEIYDSVGSNIYNASNNLIIKEQRFTDEAEVESALELLSNVLQNTNYTPAELQLVGLPYIECGDAIRVATPNGNIATLCLDRTIKGIQSLRDKISAK